MARPIIPPIRLGPDWEERLVNLCRVKFPDKIRPIPINTFANCLATSVGTFRKVRRNSEFPFHKFRDVAAKLGMTPDELKRALGEPPPFRNFHTALWQEIPWEYRPHPFPDPGYQPIPPFPAKPNSLFDHIHGWRLDLRSNEPYVVAGTFSQNLSWPELEIVVYELEPQAKKWVRIASTGAFTSHKGPLTLKPRFGMWLITCFGKKSVGSDSVWWPFDPVQSDHDGAEESLMLHFTAPDPVRRPGELPTSTDNSVASVSVDIHPIGFTAPP